MIIGVDGGALSIADNRLKVGVYKVTEQFVKHISAIDSNNNYRLYTFKRLGEGIKKPFGRNVEEKLVKPTFGWSKIWLPMELRKNPVDVFLGMSQAIPWSMSHNIGFIYDLAFLKFKDAYPESYYHLKKQTDLLISRSAYIIVNSKAVASDVHHFYPSFPKNKIIVCPLGVDPTFSNKGVRKLNKNPYFIFVGALKPMKNIPTLIRAFDEFAKKSTIPYELHIIGGDLWIDPAIDEALTRAKYKNRIRFVGHIDDSELPAYYRGATAFVSPSLWEGFCLPAVEAMASGVPVIVSNTGSLPEVVGSAGMYCDPMDALGFSRAMHAVVTSPPVQKKMMKIGLIQSKKFTWKTYTLQVVDVIHEVEREFIRK